jgi:uncharacterized membrane protein YeaQ/YmgE (transglycosylase-associated protein family)
MVMFASITLDPMNILCWLVVGAIAGFLAGKVMTGGGYGLIGDIVVGLIGAVIGGVLLGMLGGAEYGLLGTIVVAFIGACILIAILRFVGPRRTNL